MFQKEHLTDGRTGAKDGSTYRIKAPKQHTAGAGAATGADTPAVGGGGNAGGEIGGGENVGASGGGLHRYSAVAAASSPPSPSPPPPIALAPAGMVYLEPDGSPLHHKHQARRFSF